MASVRIVRTIFLGRMGGLPAAALILWCVLPLAEGIRVYTGTNEKPPIEQPLVRKPNGPAISKRSWVPVDVNIEPTNRSDRKVQDEWREIDRKSTSVDEGGEKIVKMVKETKTTPTLYKIKLTQRGYIQFLKYLAKVPAMQEYTFCLWFTSRNLTHKHPLFSYSMNEKERVLGLWFNPKDSSIQGGVRDEIIFKVPVKLRENRWYHVCQSWSGMTGEWMVFLDGRKKGSGILSQYQGTFVPGGGDVVVGQELTDADKGLDDGIEGEIFGFNLVDESVDLKDQITVLNPQYRPQVHPQNSVPPFKILPPIKKTFHEIKAYISTLPADAVPAPAEKPLLSDIAVEPNLIKTGNEILSAPQRYVRTKPRNRHKVPMRKVVVYNRQDRQLRTNAYDKKKIPEAEISPVTEGSNDISEQAQAPEGNHQFYDENYSVHSYRMPKKIPRIPAYEIYEINEEEARRPILLKTTTHAYEETGPRKSRHSFDLFSAREANKIYPLSGKIYDLPRPKFHFETRREGKAEASRRSFNVEEQPSSVTKRSTDQLPALPEFIPVYEVIQDDTPYPRRKRDVRALEPAAAEAGEFAFKRLPDIPESFIQLFSHQTSKTEMEEKLKAFFPSNKSEASTAAPGPGPASAAALSPAAAATAPDVNLTSAHILSSAKDTIQQEKNIAAMPPGWGRPQNFPDQKELERLSEAQRDRADLRVDGSRHGYSDANRRRFVVRPKVPEPQVEKGKFEISTGTELVLRSYGVCGLDRGTPVTNKKRLIVSWSDTPVRIYGGAMVANAKNICGHF